MLHILGKHWKLILVWGLIFAFLSCGASLFFPKQYSAETQVLIISRNQTGIDPYTQAKSAETVGTNLVQVMKTTDFYSKVMQSTGSFDRSQWQNLSDRDQRKKWQKDVQASMVYGTGMMNIVAYSGTQADAVALADAVSQTIASQGWEYVGGDVSIKIVGSPLASLIFARPNLILNSAIGFLVGVLICGLWVLKYKRRIFSI